MEAPPLKRFAYNGRLGQWWQERAADSAHIAAYRTIARYVHESLSRPPRLIVDYACGAGDLLVRLAWRFPFSRLVGLDGSRMLLGLACRKIAHKGHTYQQRVQLIETRLPNFALVKSSTDLAVFAFPNMQWPDSPSELKKLEGDLGQTDLAAASILANMSDHCAETRGESPGVVRHLMVLGRLVSLNLRTLLRTGGLCVRVEYSPARRDELGAVDLMRIAYEEGSLENPVRNKKPRQWFRVLASSYIRSSVSEDVYQQTRDVGDRRGGYFITVLRAI